MITLRLHYDRPDRDYRGWNAWVWPVNRGSRQVELQLTDGEQVATVTVPSSASYVNFIMRKSTPQNAWQSREDHDQRIDLVNVISGTVDCYVNSTEYAVRCVPAASARMGNKLLAAVLDYDTGWIRLHTAQPLQTPQEQLRLLCDSVRATATVCREGDGYLLKPAQTIPLEGLYRWQVELDGTACAIGLNGVYMSRRFRQAYTYDGQLGAAYTPTATEFRLWAPTAEAVQVVLYGSGTGARTGVLPMERQDRGVWYASAEGDQNGVYYTYLVTVDGSTAEVCDPYARTTGVNGQRAMVIDLASTDPAGWAQDKNPNPLKSYTDGVLYELHVRDFSIDESAGIRQDWRGKFLGLTQTGTRTPGGVPTGLDHLKSLGITHLHLLPFYDYASVDESRCDSYNWGYDPLNFNVPEGSYATDPHDGFIRVRELKQTVKTLHDNGISVIMDVVYNHVYDADTFCFNRIVPGYFSRWASDGSYSNGSGCGNDTASERDMVRRYIVDSVLYWTQQYHIDGFRFDLVGLLDTQTINAIVESVHAVRPDVIFYGEGWTMQTATEGSPVMATQPNSRQTPGFAYFSDTMRDLLGGRNGGSRGFVCGLTGKEENVANSFMAKPGWSDMPCQIVQYASCHDNYALMDKLILAAGKHQPDPDTIRRNNLAAAMYMTAQGIPFIHAGEELLRQKQNPDGSRCENSYNAPDTVNRIRWSDLEKKAVAQTADYYRGLIAFRKRHQALRLQTREQVAQCVRYHWITNEVIAFRIDGAAAGDVSRELLLIFNATDAVRRVDLPSGLWYVCVDAFTAGTDVLAMAEGYVNLPAVSAMMLIR